jgi:hypothetical protein
MARGRESHEYDVAASAACRSGLMATAAHAPSVRSLRAVIGAILFLGWVIMAALWVTSTVRSGIDGDIMPVVSAVAAIALMALLAGMEGLEIAVTDRWREVFVDGSKHDLAAWLSARQFFVAMIVTATALLAHRKFLVIPGTDRLTADLALRIYDIAFVTLTVLWFAQIFPKHLAATNPDRYLHYTRVSLFPVVEIVRRIGVSWPGEQTAAVFENRVNWHAEVAEGIEEAPALPKESLADIWRELLPERPRAS